MCFQVIIFAVPFCFEFLSGVKFPVFFQFFASCVFLFFIAFICLICFYSAFFVFAFSFFCFILCSFAFFFFFLFFCFVFFLFLYFFLRPFFFSSLFLGSSFLFTFNFFALCVLLPLWSQVFGVREEGGQLWVYFPSGSHFNFSTLSLTILAKRKRKSGHEFPFSVSQASESLMQQGTKRNDDNRSKFSMFSLFSMFMCRYLPHQGVLFLCLCLLILHRKTESRGK